LSQSRKYPPYLGVLKRHRPDEFLLTHAVDGYSLAMDFRVTQRNREAIWSLAKEMTEKVLAVGGRFYLAKDAVLQAADAERLYGRDPPDKFFELKARLDPRGVFHSDMSRRIFGERPH
jgi:decaprenylphospho-beta-D-ribofuranose 2-oxidase